MNSNVITAIPKDDVAIHLLTHSEEDVKESITVDEDKQQQPTGTHSGRNYQNIYDQVVETQIPEKGKQKELKFYKSHKNKNKEVIESPKKPFRFDMLT